MDSQYAPHQDTVRDNARPASVRVARTVDVVAGPVEVDLAMNTSSLVDRKRRQLKLRRNYTSLAQNASWRDAVGAVHKTTTECAQRMTMTNSHQKKKRLLVSPYLETIDGGRHGGKEYQMSLEGEWIDHPDLQTEFEEEGSWH